MPKFRIILLFLTGLCVLLISFTGSQNVPLFDGIGFPDEPYRYAPGKGQKQPSKPATGINFTSAIDPSAGNSIYVNSDEQGPQVLLDVDKKSLSFPSGSKKYAIKVTPSAPRNQPDEGSYLGNVYTLSFTSDVGPVSFSPRASSTITLRLPKNNGLAPVMQFSKDGVSWTKLVTTKLGNDTYTSPVAGNGQYVLYSYQAVSKPSSSSGKILGVLIIGVALIGIIFILRRNAPAAKV
jgi:hypothetical protein